MACGVVALLERWARQWAAGLLQLSPLRLVFLAFLPFFLAWTLTVTGSSRIEIVSEPQDLWLTPHDFGKQDRLLRQHIFERAKENNIVITRNPEGGDMLDKAALEEAFGIYQELVDIVIEGPQANGTLKKYTFGDLCLRAVTSGQCTINSVFAYWDYNGTEIKVDKNTHITASNAHKTDPITYGPVFPSQVMGGVSHFPNKTISKVEALKIWMYLDNSFAEDKANLYREDQLLQAWEAQFLEILSRPYKHITVYRHASRSDGDVMAQAINDHDIFLVVGALVLLLVFLCGFIIMHPNACGVPWNERCLRAGVAIMVVAFGLGAALGVTAMSALPLTGVCWYMLFFVAVSGCHGVAQMAAAIDQSTQDQGAVVRFPVAYSACAVASAINTVPVVVAYIGFAASAAVLPALRAATLAGLVGLLFNFVLLHTTFAAFMARVPRRIAKGKAYTPLTHRPRSSRPSCLHNFVKNNANSTARKSLWTLMAVALGGLAVYGVTTFRQQDTEAGVYPSSSYLHKFFVKEFEYFGELGIPVDFIVNPGCDYTSPKAGAVLLKAAHAFLTSPWIDQYYFGPPPDNINHFSWYNSFLSNLAVNKTINSTLHNGFPPQERFNEFFHDWSKQGHIYEFLTNFSPLRILPLQPLSTADFTSTRFQCLSRSLETMDLQAEAVTALHNLAQAQSTDECQFTVYCPPFFVFRTYTTVVQAVKLGIAVMAAVGFLCLLTTMDPRSATCVILAASVVVLDTVGVLMHYKGISIDQTVAVQFFFLVPLAYEALVFFVQGLSVPLPDATRTIQDAEDGLGSQFSAADGNAVARAMLQGAGSASLWCAWLPTAIGMLIVALAASSPVIAIFGQVTGFAAGMAAIHSWLAMLWLV